VERAEAEAIYDQGRDVVVAVLLRMVEQIGRLEKRVVQQGIAQSWMPLMVFAFLFGLSMDRCGPEA